MSDDGKRNEREKKIEPNDNGPRKDLSAMDVVDVLLRSKQFDAEPIYFPFELGDKDFSDLFFSLTLSLDRWFPRRHYRLGRRVLRFRLGRPCTGRLS